MLSVEVFVAKVNVEKPGKKGLLAGGFVTIRRGLPAEQGGYA
jgi:hypothetical protein